MKKIYGFLGAAALLALASCSDNNQDNPNVPDNGERNSFINVQIGMKNVGSRADNLGTVGQDFQYGTKEENTINTLYLGFYSNGTLLELADVTSLVGDAPESNDPNNIAWTVQVRVLGATAQNANQVVAYANIDESLLAGKSLTEVQAVTLDAPQGANGFPMSNSVYFNGETPVYTAEITSDNFFVEGSNGTPVEIYIERVAAKVTVPEITSVEAFVAYNVDGNAVDMTFVPEGWAVQATATSTYVLKTPGTKLTWAVPTTTDYRYYWANSVGYNAFVGLPTGAEVDGEYEWSEANPTLNYVSYNNANDGEFAAGTNGVAYTSNGGAYMMENTFPAARLTAAADYNPWSGATSVIIKGSYTTDANFTADADGSFYIRPGVKSVTDEEGKTSLANVKYIYTEDQVIAEMLKSAYSVKKNGNSLTNNDVELVYVAGDDNSNPANARYLQVKADSGDTFTLSGEASTADAVNAKLATLIVPAKLYTEGKAFFYVPLKHYVPSTQTLENLSLEGVVEGNYGIVRNNWYALTVNSIKGLGTGVGDDEDTPLPDPEDEVYYLDANINVLQWHMRNQGVDL